MRYAVAVFFLFACMVTSASAQQGCFNDLLRAIESGDARRVEQWLKHDPDLTDECGEQALIAAATKPHSGMVQLLLAHGANVNTTRGDLTPLMWAVASGTPILYSSEHVLTVQILLDKGADINLTTRHGWTALMYAAWNGDAAVTHLLLDRGADLNVKDRQGRTALIWAIMNAFHDLEGHAAVVAALLDNGANPEAKDEDGNTALMYASMYAKQHNSSRLVRLLSQAGSKPKKNE